MDVAFSIDLFDNEGDAFDRCCLLHVEGRVILKFKDVYELEAFSEKVKKCCSEIRENYL